MDVTLLYFDDCPSWQTTDQHLRQPADEFDLDIDRRKVDTPEAAEELQVYHTPDGQAGSPTLDQLREALAANHRGSGGAR